MGLGAGRPVTVRSKEEFRKLSERGLLGNYLRSWRSVDDFLDYGFLDYGQVCEWLTIRNLIPGATGFSAVVHRNSIHATIALMVATGSRKEDLYFQEIPAPRLRRNWNIEAILTTRGVSLFYEQNTTQPVRGIRERGAYADGLKAQAVLRSMEPESYDTLMEIWETYPEAVIEATEFSEQVGALGRQLVVWEVRCY